MKTLAIDFTEPKRRFFPVYAWIIKLFQGTKYSHVRLRWSTSTGKELIYEASKHSVRFLGPLASENHYPSEIVKSYEIRLSNEQYRQLIDWCIHYAGLRYGYLQALGIGIKQVLKLKKNPFDNSYNQQVCSELVGRFLKEVLKLETPIDLESAGPREIHEFLTKEKRTGRVKYIREVK